MSASKNNNFLILNISLKDQTDHVLSFGANSSSSMRECIRV